MSQQSAPSKSAGQLPVPTATTTPESSPESDPVTEDSTVNSPSESATEFPRLCSDEVNLAESEAAADETEEEAGRRFLSDRIQRLRRKAG